MAKNFGQAAAQSPTGPALKQAQAAIYEIKQDGGDAEPIERALGARSSSVKGKTLQMVPRPGLGQTG